MNTEIKFRTFNDLLNDVENDFRLLSEEGMIEPSNLIKVAQRVNYDLGLRIHQTKEIILTVENHVVKLPEDFYVLEFALMLGNFTEISDIGWGGRVTENVDVDCTDLTNCDSGPQIGGYQCCLAQPTNTCTPGQDPFAQNRVYSMCNGSRCIKVVEQKGYSIKEYTHFSRLHIKSPKYLDPGSINRFKQDCVDEAEIKNGYLYLNNTDCCKIYLSYMGALSDEDNNLLVMDHPNINNYYETALKCKILENLYFSGEEVQTKLEKMEKMRDQARIEALSIVNTPNFSELVANWKQNRELQHQRYYNYWRTSVFESRWNYLRY